MISWRWTCNAKYIPINNFIAVTTSTHETLNAAYYHRPHKLGSKDAIIVDFAQRGYSDGVYMALNTQEQISGISFESEKAKFESKVSYAIPVEVTYLTPLTKWNPYNLGFKESHEKMLLEQRMILINDNPYDPYVSTRFFEPQKFFSLGQKPVVKMLIHLHQMNYMYCHLMSQVFLKYINLVQESCSQKSLGFMEKLVNAIS